MEELGGRIEAGCEEGTVCFTLYFAQAAEKGERHE